MQGVPGVLPGTARRGLGVEDDEVHTEAAQVVASGTPDLATADHHHLRKLAAGHGVRAVVAAWGQQAACAWWAAEQVRHNSRRAGGSMVTVRLIGLVQVRDCWPIWMCWAQAAAPHWRQTPIAGV
jgi:hypothetical protein